MIKVQGMCQVNVISDPKQIAKSDSPNGKPFLSLTFENGVTVHVTTNLAEMIGGAGAGLRHRTEDEKKRTMQ